MLSDEQLMDVAATGTTMVAALRAVEAAVRAEMAAALNESFLHMRDRTAGYMGAAPVARFFHNGAAAFEWAATQARRAGAGEPLLDPPVPAAIRAQTNEGNTDE